MRLRPTANAEQCIFNVKKQLRELTDWSLHAHIRQKKYISDSSLKAQECSLFRREVQELRAACQYLGNLNLAMTKNPEIDIIDKKLQKIAKQFSGIAAVLREQTEKREAIADVFGQQLDAVEETIQQLWDLTKTMAAHRDDCNKLLKTGRQQVHKLGQQHRETRETIRGQIVKLQRVSETAKNLQTVREEDEAAIEEASEQYAQKLQPLIEENRKMLKTTKQKEKEVEVLRNQNEQLIHSLETYRKLCETEPPKEEVRGKHSKDSKAMKRPQSAAAHSSHHSNKDGRGSDKVSR